MEAIRQNWPSHPSLESFSGKQIRISAFADAQFTEAEARGDEEEEKGLLATGLLLVLRQYRRESACQLYGTLDTGLDRI